MALPSPKTLVFYSGAPFHLSSGALLPGLKIAYRTWGRLSPTADNAIVVCHALTGSADADAWWQPLIGPGKSIDTDRFFVVCSNTLGGCYGTTGPNSPAADGRKWGPRFPAVTVRDQVAVQMLLADALGIRKIHSVIGGSLGGLQALEWAWMDPTRVNSVISIAASGRHSPWCIAWSEAQRMALKADPRYRDGDYADGDAPAAGLAAARALAMISYRLAESLNQRFGSKDNDDSSSPVIAWLHHHGKSLVERFDAHSYRILLDAMDCHDVSAHRGFYREVLRSMSLPMMIGSIDTDVLYRPSEQAELVTYLPNAYHVTISSRHGHDGFLMDAEQFAQPISDFLDTL
jgi:homoserine O-acetyltransferase